MAGKKQQSPVNAVELVNRIAALPHCPPALLLIVPDRVRAERLLDTVLAPFLKGAAHDPAVKNIGGRDVSVQAIAAITQELSSLSLFAPAKYVVIRGVDQTPAPAIEKLLALLDEIPEGAHLLLIANSLAASHPLIKYFKKRELLIELEPLARDEMNRWAQKELRRAGIEDFAPEVVPALVELAAGSADELYRLIQHVSLFIEGARLTTADLSAVFADRPDPNEFKLLSAITEKRRTEAELLIHELFESGKNSFLLLALLARNFTTYFSIKALTLRGAGADQIRQELRVAPWLFEKHLASVRKYSLEKLDQNLAAIARADAKLKNRSLGPEAIFSELVEALMP